MARKTDEEIEIFPHEIVMVEDEEKKILSGFTEEEMRVFKKETPLPEPVLIRCLALIKMLDQGDRSYLTRLYVGTNDGSRISEKNPAWGEPGSAMSAAREKLLLLKLALHVPERAYEARPGHVEITMQGLYVFKLLKDREGKTRWNKKTSSENKT